MSTKRRSPAKLAAPVVKANARRPTKTTIDEGRTTVSGAEILHSSLIGSTKEAPLVLDSDPDLSDDEEEAQNGEAEAVDTMDVAVRTNGRPSSVERAEAEGQEEQGEGEGEGEAEEEEPTSPSFGELLRRDGAVIDVSAMLKKPAAPDAPAAATASTAVSASALAVHDGGADGKTEEGGSGKVLRPTHQSLVTVLSQALSTDDADLLESCLQTTDLVTVRNTIEGIDSALAGVLLHKLAARMHRRPGRVGTLMTWVQWTLIAHGGALAAQPRAVHSLGSLRKVLVERAKGLNSLLALKGKLDILEGQMELRKKMQTSSKRNRRDVLRQEADGKRVINGYHNSNSHNHVEDGSDDNVIYVEDEEEGGDEEDGAAKRRLRGANNDDDEEEYYDDNLLNNALLSEFAGLSEDEEDKSEESESDDAREGEDEDGDEVDFDDVDEESAGAAEEEDESEGEAAPPAKVQKVKKSAFGKRK